MNSSARPPRLTGTPSVPLVEEEASAPPVISEPVAAEVAAAAVSSAAAPSAPSTPAFDKEASAAAFRLYRSVPLDVVLQKLGATAPSASGEAWTLSNGQALRFQGRPGWQTWKNETTGEENRGAIDLVVHAKGWKSTRSALQWLKENIPDAQDLVPPPSPSGQARAVGSQASLDGGVRGQGPARRQFTEEDKIKLNEKFERYTQVRLEEVFSRLGADPNQDGDKSKWKVPGLGNFITKGQSWKNVQTEVDKGFGGVALVNHVLGLDNRMKALQWMVKEFGEEFGDDLLAEESENTGPKYFSPPERFQELNAQVAEYLVEKRKLPSHLVDQVLREGSVYGSHPWYEGGQKYLTHVVRCVFMGPASAELRDAELRETDPPGFKGCCTGSQTDTSGFSVRPANEVSEFLVSMTEAAIDGLSYRALFPGRFAMSTNGAGRFLLQFKVAREALDRGFGVRMALDADGAGDLGSQKLFNAFYVRKALGHHLQVDEARVDEWLEAGDLQLVVDKSPHQMFFNTGWLPELPVFKGELQDNQGHALKESSVSAEDIVHVDEGESAEAPKGVRMVWKASGENAKPSIQLVIRKDLHPKLLRGSMILPVSQAGYRYVVDTLNIRRDRPIHRKDWNEELKRLGETFALDYNEKAKSGFSKGLPSLPPELEALRSTAPLVPVASASADQPPRPSAPQGAGRPVGQAVAAPSADASVAAPRSAADPTAPGRPRPIGSRR